MVAMDLQKALESNWRVLVRKLSTFLCVGKGPCYERLLYPCCAAVEQCMLAHEDLSFVAPIFIV